MHHRLLACGSEYYATQSYARPRYFLYPCSHDGRRERSSRAMGAGLATRYELTTHAPELFAALRRYWELAYDLAAVAAYIGAILLLLVVLFGRSNYPRWTVLANFGLLLLLEPLASQVPSPLGAVLVGGFTNLSIAVFFLVSVLSTWNATKI